MKKSLFYSAVSLSFLLSVSVIALPVNAQEVDGEDNASVNTEAHSTLEEYMNYADTMPPQKTGKSSKRVVTLGVNSAYDGTHDASQYKDKYYKRPEHLDVSEGDDSLGDNDGGNSDNGNNDGGGGFASIDDEEDYDGWSDDDFGSSAEPVLPEVEPMPVAEATDDGGSDHTGGAPSDYDAGVYADMQGEKERIYLSFHQQYPELSDRFINDPRLDYAIENLDFEAFSALAEEYQEIYDSYFAAADEYSDNTIPDVLTKPRPIDLPDDSDPVTRPVDDDNPVIIDPLPPKGGSGASVDDEKMAEKIEKKVNKIIEKLGKKNPDLAEDFLSDPRVAEAISANDLDAIKTLTDEYRANMRNYSGFHIQ